MATQTTLSQVSTLTPSPKQNAIVTEPSQAPPSSDPIDVSFAMKIFFPIVLGIVVVTLYRAEQSIQRRR